jgi:hypothetical protein
MTRPGSSSMLRIIALSVVAFVVVGSLYDFPGACYDRHVFGSCVRAQANALASLTLRPNSVLGDTVVNWEDPRVTKR